MLQEKIILQKSRMKLAKKKLVLKRDQSEINSSGKNLNFIVGMSISQILMLLNSTPLLSSEINLQLYHCSDESKQSKYTVVLCELILYHENQFCLSSCNYNKP
jgi:hypothetical protein